VPDVATEAAWKHAYHSKQVFLLTQWVSNFDCFRISYRIERNMDCMAALSEFRIHFIEQT
jgi:hypothetical protein